MELRGWCRERNYGGMFLIVCVGWVRRAFCGHVGA